MAAYLIGDVQGCDDALGRLLATIDFSPSRDCLYLLGDLVNRGPRSAEVLRRVMALGASAKFVLGNHDLSLLAMAERLRAPHRGDTAQEILSAEDREPLLEFLRHGRMAMVEQGVLMVHGGVLPQWDAEQTLALAREVESALRSPGRSAFLAQMYGNQPDRWSDSLEGADRLRVVVNALTRLRFCTADGVMDMKTSGGLESQPAGYMPWFDVPGRRTAGIRIAFGHWSTLGYLKRDHVVSLDTGCVWGGCLSALRLGADELIQVKCEQAREPGT